MIQGPIQIEKGVMKLSCDSVTAYGKEEIIEAVGGVHFNYLRIKGESDFATFDRKSQVVVLTGNPKAWQNQDMLTGKSITIDLKREKVTTLGKARVVLSLDTLQQKN